MMIRVLTFATVLSGTLAGLMFWLDTAEGSCACGHGDGEHAGAWFKDGDTWRQDCLANGCDCMVMRRTRRKTT